MQFNLKNVHYAVHKITDGKVGFEKPVAVPGAVSLAMEQQGEVSPFYADGIVFYQASSNSGYQGDLEMAMFPDQMMIDIWKNTETETDHVILENANVEPASFALLFQIDGDAHNRYYCLYNCTATRPGIGGQTNTNTKTPQTQKSTISAAPLDDGTIKANTKADTAKAVLDSWFNQVYIANKPEQVTQNG